MYPFKFLTSNQNKNNLVNLIFEDYLKDLNDIVLEVIDYEGRTVTTNNGIYHITNVNYNYNSVYSRAICYPNDYPNLIIRMSTYPNEINITVGDRVNSSPRFSGSTQS